MSTTPNSPSTPAAAPAREAGHTPGPWTCEVRRYPNGKLVAIPYLYAPNAPDGQRHLGEVWGDAPEANARLIAAAPDLLTSLRRLYEATYGRTDLVAKLDFEHARAAIARATR